MKTSPFQKTDKTSWWKTAEGFQEKTVAWQATAATLSGIFVTWPQIPSVLFECKETAGIQLERAVLVLKMGKASLVMDPPQEAMLTLLQEKSNQCF